MGPGMEPEKKKSTMFMSMKKCTDFAQYITSIICQCIPVAVVGQGVIIPSNRVYSWLYYPPVTVLLSSLTALGHKMLYDHHVTGVTISLWLVLLSPSDSGWAKCYYPLVSGCVILSPCDWCYYSKPCLPRTVWQKDTCCLGTFLLDMDWFSTVNTLWWGDTCQLQTADRQITEFSICCLAGGDSLV